MKLDHHLPLAGGVRIVVSLATSIGGALPRASRIDRLAWAALQRELHNVVRLAPRASRASAHDLLVDMMELLLAFRGSMSPRPRPS